MVGGVDWFCAGPFREGGEDGTSSSVIFGVVRVEYSDVNVCFEARDFDVRDRMYPTRAIARLLKAFKLSLWLGSVP